MTDSPTVTPVAYRRASEDRFRPTKDAYAIRRGKMWVSTIDPCPELGVAGNVLHFAGLDHLTLSVAEARAFRDWLTSVLPEPLCDCGAPDEAHYYKDDGLYYPRKNP